MATGDFSWLKLQLANMVGRATVAQLADDVNSDVLAGQIINEAYLECYQPSWPGARRPGWALKNFGIQYSAPVSGTVTVTQGSNSFSALTGVSASMAGSAIQIGANYYTLASTTSTVEPIQEPSGSQAFTVYHNSYPVDAADIEVQGDPMVIGYGILRPMTGRGESIRWRQITFGDFWGPAPYGAGLMITINWPGGVSLPTGTPIFYYVDNSILPGASAIQARVIIWPVPTVITTLQFQGWVVPTELSNDADLPVLPANLITRVLLPLARERWAKAYKKYTGDNIPYLTEQANQARRVLDHTATGQRQMPIRMPLKNI